MAITIESLNERKTAIQDDMEKVRETISQLDSKRQELVNNLNALSGALQQCDQFISQLSEQVAEDFAPELDSEEPKTKTDK